MRTLIVSFGSTALIIFSLGPGRADAPLGGRFVATEPCPAFQSLRNSFNPGDVEIEPHEGYELIGKDTSDATHYHIIIKGADPEERWVSSSCGRVEVTVK